MPGRSALLAAVGLGLAGIGAYRARRNFYARSLKIAPPRYNVRVERNLDVPMRDGVHLRADHYSPTTAGSYPTILIRTPYGRGLETGRFGLIGRLSVFTGWRFAERGYHVVIQGVRGRFDSQGVFDANVEENSDGQDTVEWLNRQPWFDGRLAMFGSSYLGNVQWAVAAGNPGALKALAPSITGSQFYTLINRSNTYALDLMLRWAYLVETMDSKGRHSELKTLRQLSPANVEKKLQPAYMKLPLADLDKHIVGREVHYYQAWMHNPHRDDDYWKRQDYSVAVPQLAAPVNFVGGWYDMLLPELLSDYALLRQAGQTPYLLIGPWTHTNFELQRVALREGLSWFDAHLKGDKSSLRAQPVRIFVMGANQWRDLPEWPPAYEPTRYYLQGQGGLGPEKAAAAVPSDHYRYDPADPTPALSGPLFQEQRGYTDNRPLEDRPDVLTFTTPPLSQDLEVIGPVRLELYVKSSLEYTDFFGRVCDVKVDGASINVCDGLFRVRPGQGEPQPDGSLRIEIELYPTAYRFLKNHSIRLQVSSGAHPRFNRNLGTDEDPAFATRMQAADQTIYHDADHPAALVLPLATN